MTLNGQGRRTISVYIYLSLLGGTRKCFLLSGFRLVPEGKMLASRFSKRSKLVLAALRQSFHSKWVSAITCRI